MRSIHCFGAALLLASLSACNCTNASVSTYPDGGRVPDGGSVSLPGLTSLTLAPANQTLTIDGGAPATSDYTALGTFLDGHTQDVTAYTSFALVDPTLGSFSGNHFTSTVNYGGVTTVMGQSGSVQGSTGLTLRIRERLNDPGSTGLPANPASLFTGPQTGTAPQIVYPADGVLIPPNLGKLEIHFLPGSGNAVFAMNFGNSLVDVTVYMTCAQPLNGGCIYLPPASVWSYVATSARGIDPVVVTVQGTATGGGPVGSSTPVHVAFSQDNINGGLYYWTTSNGTAIMRYDFAGTMTAPAKFVGTNLTGGTCVGCHALSRDGTKLVAEAGGQNDGRLLFLNVATQTPLVPFPTASAKSVFESWSPDGGSYVGVYGDNGATDYGLMLFNGSTGAQTGSVAATGDATHPADHPDWSPDGLKIAYVKVGNAGTDQRMWTGAIEMVTTANGSTWSSPLEIVPSASGKNRYYPAFAPDSQFLLFDESTCASSALDMSCDADTDSTATLFAAQAQAGATPVPLAKANAPGIMDQGATDLTNSFPKWSPFVFQRTLESGSRLMWVTFSSSRNYGLRPPPTPGGTEHPSSGTLIWMAAIDPDKVASGQDPSYPAFCLPFQDVTTSNHIAQWTTQVVGVIQ